MSKKKTYKTKLTSTIAAEPNTAFDSKRITFFNSFKEENEFTYMERALTSPIKNFITVTSMLKLHFKKKLEENLTLGNRIFFNKQ